MKTARRLKNNKEPCPSKDRMKKLSPQSRRLSALLIEDNHVIQKLHSRYLHNLNYTVQLATTQQQALKHAFTHRYDLVIADLGLPDNNGETMITNLRQAPSVNCRTPLLVVTTYTNPSLKSRCLRAGANDFIIKPLPQMLLEATLKKLCACSSNTLSFSTLQ